MTEERLLRLRRLYELVRGLPLMTAEDRYHQRINLAHGNLPLEMQGQGIERMYAADTLMRSLGGWDGRLESLP